MQFTQPDGTPWRFHEAWRAELLEGELRYKQDWNEKIKAEYRRVLKIFAQIVMQDPSSRK